MSSGETASTGAKTDGRREFTPLSWSEFFDRKEVVTTAEGDQFCVYTKGTRGPLFFLLHGGGYTGLTWACFTEELTKRIECRVAACDLRGHGETTLVSDVDDYSVARQIKDVQDVHAALYGQERPPLILIGHSMGGALAVHAAHAKLLPNLQALAVIDVVEGSAMASLTSMPSYIRSRPQRFSSEEEAIKWSLQHTCRNNRSARVSMPSQIKRIEESNGKTAYVWRTDLLATTPFWAEWFKSLSSTFLDTQAVKILILAGVDRLDRELLVRPCSTASRGFECRDSTPTRCIQTAQMKGMFQTEVLPKVGHAVHEDSPEKVAEIFVALVNRYKVIFNKAAST